MLADFLDIFDQLYALLNAIIEALVLDCLSFLEKINIA
jgi:hypothetical protein